MAAMAMAGSGANDGGAEGDGADASSDAPAPAGEAEEAGEGGGVWLARAVARVARRVSGWFGFGPDDGCAEEAGGSEDVFPRRFQMLGVGADVGLVDADHDGDDVGDATIYFTEVPPS